MSVFWERRSLSLLSLSVLPGYLFENDSRVVPEKFEGESSPRRLANASRSGFTPPRAPLTPAVSHGAVGERALALA